MVILMIKNRAENVLAGWEALSNASTKIYNNLSSDKKAAFFEMIQHPVLASYTVGQLWINQGQNLLRASQARFSANNLADQVESLFEQDYSIEQEYHSLLNGNCAFLSLTSLSSNSQSTGKWNQ